jgi:chromosome segregation ATPase
VEQKANTAEELAEIRLRRATDEIREIDARVRDLKQRREQAEKTIMVATEELGHALDAARSAVEGTLPMPSSAPPHGY